MRTRLQTLADALDVKFGTSGVRGLVVNLTDALCYAYTQAFLNTVAGKAPRILIGHDLRPSSPRIAAACAQAIHDAGREVVFIGAVPTPALAYACLRQQAPGLIVTGSHIPFDRNGIKFYRADGEIDKADERAIVEAMVEVPAALSPRPLPAVSATALEDYVQRYVGFFGAGALAGRRVAFYEHSSVARDVLRRILEALGAEVLSLGRTDQFVPIDTEAVAPEDIQRARDWARQHRFDALVSTDGDADRPLIGDEQGQWLRGDVVGILCARALAADIVVTPVSSNSALEQCGAFRQVLRTRIGSPYVIEGMQTAAAASSDAGAVVAGYEANGGFLLGSVIQREGRRMSALPTRDAVLPMLALLTTAAARQVPLSALPRDLPPRFTASDRVQQIPTDRSRQLLQALEDDVARSAALMAPEAGAVVSRNTVDGLRLTFASGDVVHLRPSGNAPELRCYTESATEAQAQALCAACLRRVAAVLQSPPA